MRKTSSILSKLLPLRYLLFLVLLVGYISHSNANSLINGGIVSGAIDIPGDIDTYEFTVNEGEYVRISVADTNNSTLYPSITIFDPSGDAISSTSESDVSTLAIFAPSSGTYRFTVRDNTPFTSNNNGVGAYQIHYVNAPGANEHGSLANGDFVSEEITLGDIDSWVLEANAGDYVLLSLVDIAQTNLGVEIALYAPDGSRVIVDNQATATRVSMFAPVTGTYTVLVYDNTPFSGNNTGTGRYDLHYAKAPGANEHGSLANGDFVSEEITLGDIDSWVLDAEAGDYVVLSLVDIAQSNLGAEIALYAPDGSRVIVDNQATATRVSMFAPQTGTYTVLVYDNTPFSGNNTGTGRYDLHYAKAPSANEHGSLANGDFVSEEITLGDIDSWVLEANAGDYVLLSLVDIAQINLGVEIALYAPDGSRVIVDNQATATRVSMFAPVTGTYTVLVYDNTPFSGNNTGTGRYDLHYAKAPGANEHGSLANGDFVSEEITLGDIDSWVLDAEAGDYVVLSLVDIAQSNLGAEIALYAPDGSRVRINNQASVARVSMYAPVTGTYTVLVYDNTPFSGNNTGTGAYQLHYAKVPEASEHGVLSGVGSASETVSLGDIDSYRIVGNVGSQISLRITDINADSVSLQALLFTQQSTLILNQIDSNEILVTDFNLPDDGIYTLLIFDNTSFTDNETGIGDYTIAFDVPVAPPEPEAPIAIISAPDTAFRNENISLDAGLSFDPDNLPQALSYEWRFIQVPDGSLVSNASLSSTTSITSSFVADVLGTYNIELLVDDGASTTSTMATISVVNAVPVADAGVAQMLENGVLATLDASASFDADGDMLSYMWTVVQQPLNAAITLSDTTSSQPSFTPIIDGVYTFGLTVSDGYAVSIIDTVDITITTENTAPTAIINVSGPLIVGAELILDASQSSDADNAPLPLQYTWESIGLLNANLNSFNQVSSSFIPQQAGVYTVALSVSDGDLVTIATVDISVAQPVDENQAPVANAGEDQTLVLSQTVQLDGSLTSDPDAAPEPLSLVWTFVSVPVDSALTSTDIVAATSTMPSFTPDVEGVFVLQIEAFDGQDTDSDSVVVTVSPPAPLRCDINANGSIDFNDVVAIAGMIGNTASGEDDPADWNQDGLISVRDARGCLSRCTLPRCAIVSN